MGNATARTDTWAEDLARFIENRRGLPFSWAGRHCVAFVADAVLVMTGRDYMADLRHIRTAAQARRAQGRCSLSERAAECLGQMASATQAQRGDVVLIAHEGRQWLGLCVGAEWVAQGHGGLVFGPMQTAVGSWPIGRGG